MISLLNEIFMAPDGSETVYMESILYARRVLMGKSCECKVLNASMSDLLLDASLSHGRLAPRTALLAHEARQRYAPWGGWDDARACAALSTGGCNAPQ